MYHHGQKMPYFSSLPNIFLYLKLKHAQCLFIFTSRIFINFLFWMWVECEAVTLRIRPEAIYFKMVKIKFKWHDIILIVNNVDETKKTYTKKFIHKKFWNINVLIRLVFDVHYYEIDLHRYLYQNRFQNRFLHIFFWSIAEFIGK